METDTAEKVKAELRDLVEVVASVESILTSAHMVLQGVENRVRNLARLTGAFS